MFKHGNHNQFHLIDNQIWKRTKIDAKGRCVLPKKLRQKIGLHSQNEILWICVHSQSGKEHLYTIEIGIKHRGVNEK